MTDAFSAAEQQFRKVMGVLALLYLAAILLFVLAPDKAVSASNAVGGVFKMDKAPVPEQIGEALRSDKPLVMGRGYVAMACAFATLLAGIAFGAFLSPRSSHGRMPTFLALNGFAAFYGFAFYFLQMKTDGVRYFGNMAIGIIHVLVLVVAGVLWWRAKGSRSASF
ncbi:MAG: hypothetical protein M5R36_26360 [Deltaproteobacteria bacterium]|nr:hypothetical protein [Deltaproteobacteria bacterium]